MMIQALVSLSLVAVLVLTAQAQSADRSDKDNDRAVELVSTGAPETSMTPRIPSWFPRVPPLLAPTGAVLRVATVDELFAAADRVESGGTILLADGHYKLSRPIVLQEKKDISLRGASGDAAKVILSGQGWDSPAKNDDLLHIGRCDGVTIADLTFADCRSYGVKVEAENAPKNIHIYRCHFRNIGVRAIKGSAGQDPNIRAIKGSVRGCYFENTKVPPADWLFGGDYIAAIDMMALEDWTFSENVFRNIKGRNGGGRAAIFIWVRSRRVVVERNLMVDCDRGIAFGNPGQSTANLAGERLVYVADSLIRNNLIAGGADCGIELWHVDGIKIYHNSIWRPERHWSRGIRIGAGTTNTDIANNLVHGEIQNEGGEARLRHNLAGRLENFFVNPMAGELVLTPAARGAINQGAHLPAVTEDIRGQPRTGNPDLGAWEYTTPATRSQADDQPGRQAGQSDANFRRPRDQDDLRYWLENMLVYHRFTLDEASQATGLTPGEIEQAARKSGLLGKSPPVRPASAPLRVLPYPGGRHPRIGFLEGAIRPQRETKFSVFTPWDEASYVVVDVPEAIWSNLGLTYLAHTHIDTLWSKRNIEMEPLEWKRGPDESLESERLLPNGIAFGAQVNPSPEAVRMHLWLRNGTGETLRELRVQNCIMLKNAAGFNAQTLTNKVFAKPYAAARSEGGRRWIITAWQPADRCWGNDQVPCLHADPKFPDCPPGQTVHLRGWLSFYEGQDVTAEFKRIEQTEWRK